jgi:hypothetical protein
MSQQSNGSRKPGVAIFGDLQNVQPSVEQIQALDAFACRQGIVTKKYAYLDCCRGNRELLDKLYCEGFETINVPSGKEHPNRADRKLEQHCRQQVLENSAINTAFFLSQDGDFVPLVFELKAQGKKVILVVRDKEKTSKKLKAAVDELYTLNQIEQWFEKWQFVA